MPPPLHDGRSTTLSSSTWRGGDDSRSRTRWYRRDIATKDSDQPLTRHGWLYVLPRDTFRAERRRYGLDIAHWVSDTPVVPLFSLPLNPATYPLTRHIRAVPRSSADLWMSQPARCR